MFNSGISEIIMYENDIFLFTFNKRLRKQWPGLSFINCLKTLESVLGNLDFNLEMQARRSESSRQSNS